jgi:hypothetical protein
MRGLHSTLAVEHVVSAQVVAASLGHESSTTTIQSYIRPEAVAAPGAEPARRWKNRLLSAQAFETIGLGNVSNGLSRKIEPSTFVEMNGIEPSAS